MVGVWTEILIQNCRSIVIRLLWWEGAVVRTAATALTRRLTTVLRVSVGGEWETCTKLCYSFHFLFPSTENSGLGVRLLLLVHKKYQKSVIKSEGPNGNKYFLGVPDLIYRIQNSLKEIVVVYLFGGSLHFLLQRKLAKGCNLITSSQLVACFHSTITAIFYCCYETNFY